MIIELCDHEELYFSVHPFILMQVGVGHLEKHSSQLEKGCSLIAHRLLARYINLFLLSVQFVYSVVTKRYEIDIF